jgi:hypothetical protein
VASNIGAPRHPDWYINLLANPEVTVEVGGETYDAAASTAEGGGRGADATLDHAQANASVLADHEAKTVSGPATLDHAAICPVRVEKMSRAGPDTPPLLVTNALVGLNTCPVGKHGLIAVLRAPAGDGD